MTDEHLTAGIAAPAPAAAQVAPRSRARELGGVALFLAPAFSLLALFMFYPIGSTILMSSRLAFDAFSTTFWPATADRTLSTRSQ